jgi:hypothetical protein
VPVIVAQAEDGLRKPIVTGENMHHFHIMAAAGPNAVLNAQESGAGNLHHLRSPNYR